MKFGRYLRDSLIPEWRKAYIDYRGLKKLMKRIAEQEYAGSAGPSRPHGRYAAADALAAQGESVAPLSPMSPLSPRSPRSPGSPGSPGSQGKGKQPDGEQTPRGRRESEATDATEGTLRDLGEFGGAVPAEGGAPPGAARLDGGGYEEEGYGYGWKVGNGTGPGDGSGSKGPVGNNTPRAGVGERDRAGEGTAVLPVNRSRLALSLRSSRSGASASAKSNRSGRSGFRAALGGGGGSRKARSQKSGARIPLEPSTLSDLLHTLTPAERSYFDKLDTELDKVSTFYNEREREARERAQLLLGQLEELKEHREAFYAAYPKHPSGPWTQRVFGAVASRTPAPPHFPHLPHLPQGLRFLTGSTDALSLDIAEEREALDPHGYVAAKRRLKKALQEYYRGLELLDNYRILNLTGFRKALKKFEKTTGVLFAQKLYMNERIEPLPISNPDTLHNLRIQMEVVYADRFVSGDRKRARDRLRAEVTPKTHHFSTFRAGLFVGLGIPAIVLGVVRSFDPYVRSVVPEWDSLLNIYGVLFILPVFVFLIGLNLCAWTRARINWVFIFDLDVRSVLDYRQFFELPAFLFMTLAYCFFFSYCLVDNPRVAPHTWPLAWVVFALLMLINPLPILRRRARYWFLYMVGRLLVSGATRVEFADFWLGDQFCSMAYTLGNLYVFGCAYNNDWNGVSALCGTANTWVAAFLSALPYALRCSQCVRRWADSGLKIHLLNAGKYIASIVVYVTYYHWRHLGSGRDTSFIVYVLFATIGSIYTCSWDLLMDWSLMRPKAPHKFLREDLIYGKEAVPLYYFAIVSNIILRFEWVFYIPTGGLSLTVRAWLFAVLEALRRFQWNFYRVENEHIGNADRYRVTKEIPLPYTVRPGDDADDADDSDQEGPTSIRSMLSGRSKKSEPARTSSFHGRKGLEDGTREREASRVVEQDL